MSLVSVIIPTHNRARYCIPTVRGVLDTHADIQVVVSDTSAADELSEIFEQEIASGSLVLLRHSQQMSVVDNFNEALKAATGSYLVFIGDDDFVSAELVTVANWAKEKKVDSIKFSFPTLYFWPDFRHKTQHDAIAGTLITNRFNGKVTAHNAKLAASKALANFGGGVMEMPRAYAGMISRNLVSRIEKKYGLLFGGVSPDIYSAFLISQEAENCVYIDYPAIIPGASGASTAGQSAKGKHVGGLRDNAHISPFRDLIWDQKIPEFYSVPTVWSFSLLKAVECSGTSLEKINFARLYVKCLLYHHQYSKETAAAIKSYSKQFSAFKLAMSTIIAVVQETIWVVKKIYQKLAQKNNSDNGQTVEINLEDTKAASEKMREILLEKKITLELI